jgi:hypothetical protein
MEIGNNPTPYKKKEQANDEVVSLCTSQNEIEYQKISATAKGLIIQTNKFRERSNWTIDDVR